MKLKKLVESKTALEMLLKSPLPIGIAWELKNLVTEVNPLLSSFEELKNQKIIELGEEQKSNGKVVGHTVKPENMEEFIKVTNELLEKEVEISVPQIKIKELKDYKDVNGKGIEMTTGQLMTLEWLIVN